ncbi:MAG TPA: hypothetical protein VK177_14150 [Flavobacteriales bacterium]|nr:hypothetical protein [Flavobacteriales bacterium]
MRVHSYFLFSFILFAFSFKGSESYLKGKIINIGFAHTDDFRYRKMGFVLQCDSTVDYGGFNPSPFFSENELPLKIRSKWNVPFKKLTPKIVESYNFSELILETSSGFRNYSYAIPDLMISDLNLPKVFNSEEDICYMGPHVGQNTNTPDTMLIRLASFPTEKFRLHIVVKNIHNEFKGYFTSEWMAGVPDNPFHYSDRND